MKIEKILIRMVIATILSLAYMGIDRYITNIVIRFSPEVTENTFKTAFTLALFLWAIITFVSFFIVQAIESKIE